MNSKLAVLCLTGALVMSAPVCAATVTTSDGVMTIETPDDSWAVVADANHWLSLSNGSDRIVVEHLSNGEALPSVQVANPSYKAVYQAFVSTENEVFVVIGEAAQKENLQKLMEAIQTIKIQKLDTKTAINTPAPQPASEEFGLRQIGANYSVAATDLKVRASYSTDSQDLGTLNTGDVVYVLAAVTRGGKDYGWYQINYNNGTAYVSAQFLSPNPTSGSSSSGQSKAPAGAESKVLYYYGGNLSVTIHKNANGVWVDDTGRTYTQIDGDRWQDSDGVTLYTSNSGWGDLIDTPTMTLYTHGGTSSISIYQQSNGVWTNGYGLTYTSNGDGTWTDSNGVMLYETNEGWGDIVDDPGVEASYIPDSDSSIVVHDGYGGAVEIEPSGESDGAYIDDAGNTYYEQADGSWLDPDNDISYTEGDV